MVQDLSLPTCRTVTPVPDRALSHLASPKIDQRGGPRQILDSDHHVFTLPDQECLNAHQIAMVRNYVLKNGIQQVTIIDTQVSAPIVALCQSLCELSTLPHVTITDHHLSNKPFHASNSSIDTLRHSRASGKIKYDLHTREEIPACALLVDAARADLPLKTLTIAIPLDVDAAVSIALLSGVGNKQFDKEALNFINRTIEKSYPDLLDRDLWHPLQLAALLDDSPDIRSIFARGTPLGNAKDLLLSSYSHHAAFSDVIHEMLRVYPSLTNEIFCMWAETMSQDGKGQSLDDRCLASASPFRTQYKKAKDFLAMRERLLHRPKMGDYEIPEIDLNSLAELFCRLDTITDFPDQKMARFGHNIARRACRELQLSGTKFYPEEMQQAPFTIVKSPMYDKIHGTEQWNLIVLHGSSLSNEKIKKELFSTFVVEAKEERPLFFSPFRGAIAVLERDAEQAKRILQEELRV